MEENQTNPYLKYSSLGLQLFASIGIAAWLGHKADLYFGFKFPVFLLSLVFISFGAVMFKLYQSITKEK